MFVVVDYLHYKNHRVQHSEFKDDAEYVNNEGLISSDETPKFQWSGTSTSIHSRSITRKKHEEAVKQLSVY